VRGERIRSPRVLIVALVVLLALGLVAARSCGPGTGAISQERALELAIAEAGFTPTDSRIRMIRQGVPSRPVWLVGLRAPEGGAVTFEVDAATGAVRIADVEEAGGEDG
jgi:uncharacterized membrane protein YkoI